MSDRDSLTRLRTRDALDTELPQAISDAAKASHPLSLIMVDLDRFKSVNDTHGHPKGDSVLAGVAGALESIIEGKGQVYRYGGEEMLIVLPNHTVLEAVAVAERARRELESAEIAGLKITASFGVASFPDHGSNETDLVKGADDALYDAKNQGRNLVRAFGEPEPPKERAREPYRKLPEPGALTEKQRDDLRAAYFRTYGIRCPNDGALLEVHERNEMGKPTPRLSIWCKLCGLMDEI